MDISNKFFRPHPLYTSLFLAAAAFSVSNAYASISTRIVGGTQSTEGDWPWMVSLQDSSASNTLSGHYCGATLINANWVLTAAHCVDGALPGDFVVQIGAYDLSTSSKAGTRVAISRILIHPAYDSATNDNDLALLQLASSQSSSTIPVISSSSMSSVAAGADLVTMGWGTTRYNSANYPSILRQVTVPLVDQATCVSDYKAIGQSITDNMICAGETAGGKDSCQGDSGGPLIYEDSGTWKQVGVVSFGNGCALAGYPGVYTRIANYTDWLGQNESHLSADTRLDFGYIPEYTSVSKNLSVVNFGAAAKLDSSTLSSSSTFSIGSNGCLSELSQGASCQIGVTLADVASGDYAATVTSTGSSELVSLQTNLTATVLPVKSFTYSLASGVTWYSGGDAQWSDSQSGISTSSTHYYQIGPESLREGNGVLETKVTGPVTASFQWRLYNSDGYSVLNAYLDGEKVATASSSWSTAAVTIPEGSHILEWRYSTSGSTGVAQLASFSTSSSSGSSDSSSSTDTSNSTSSSTSTSSSGGGGAMGLWGLMLLGAGLMTRKRRTQG